MLPPFVWKLPPLSPTFLFIRKIGVSFNGETLRACLPIDKLSSKAIFYSFELNSFHQPESLLKASKYTFLITGLLFVLLLTNLP